MARWVYDYSSNLGDPTHTEREMTRAHSLCIEGLSRVLAIHQRKVHCVT